MTIKITPNDHNNPPGNVNGERRSFALLRQIADAAGQDRIRELILDAYAEYEAQAVRS